MCDHKYLTSPWKPWPIEIDGLYNLYTELKNGGSFHGKLLNNQMVILIIMVIILIIVIRYVCIYVFDHWIRSCSYQ